MILFLGLLPDGLGKCERTQSIFLFPCHSDQREESLELPTNNNEILHCVQYDKTLTPL